MRRTVRQQSEGNGHGHGADLTRPNGHPILQRTETPVRILKTFFAGGFECSTFRRRSGLRIDLIEATQHDIFARSDYQALTEEGIGVAREGVRWHLVERTPGRYDFSSVLPIVRAARATGTQVIWDLCHFGWPDHLDLFGPEFGPSLARYGAAFVRWLSKEMPGVPFIVPVNEISYFSWASGEEGSMDPFARGRGYELKCQLVRAAIHTMDAIWAACPDARFVHVDPIIHVRAHPKHPDEAAAAEAYRLSQYQALEMIAGRIQPELGGAEKYLDLVGVNFYPHNQWFYNLNGVRQVRKWKAINRNSPLYRPFREMLEEVYGRFGRPLFIAETGAENRLRRGWFRYVCREVQAALAQGVPVHGICLYPILNHPGWEDDRHCYNALWDYADKQGKRKMYGPLAEELRDWRQVFEPESMVRRTEPAAPRQRSSSHSAESI
jgi:hypothetical protein